MLMQATIDVSCDIFVCCFYKKNYQSLYELKNISLIKNLSILYIKNIKLWNRVMSVIYFVLNERDCK